MIDIVGSEQTYKQKLLGQRSNVTLVEDIDRVHYGDIPFVEPKYAQAGDILVTNETDKFFVKPEIYKTLKDRIGKDIHPIGVCAVPAALTKLGKSGVNIGKARVVSLANMSLKNPEKGSLKPNGILEDNAMYWGEMGTYLSGFNTGDERYRPAWIDLKTGVITENSEIQSVYLPSTAAELEVLSNKRYVDKSDPKLPKYFFSEFDQLRGDAAAGVSPYGRYGKYYFKGYLGILMGKEITDTIISKVTAEWGGGCN